MPKIEQKLMEGRIEAVLYLWKLEYTAEEIGKIFDLTTSRVYAIIKETKVDEDKDLIRYSLLTKKGKLNDNSKKSGRNNGRDSGR